ncbi:MAG: DUF2267 domain-containing protein [Actinobacteria bacterium]|nr:DUF2267 domain-containing protein [Actinomycetota bacterium]
MDRKELLTKVKEEAGLESLKQADGAVRVIVGVLKTILPEEIASEVEGSLPRDLREGWKVVEPFPSDILEREDMYFEGMETGETRPTPTITHG